MTDPGYSFVDSIDPDITETIPTSISARPADSPVYVSSGVLADVAINGMAFRYAIDDQNTYQRQTSDFRRTQIDTSKEPGEQSLNQWWVRDQDSWHIGAGINYYEPGSNQTTEYRYAKSMGVDVWTEGQASLLHSCPQLIAATSGQSCYVTSAVISGTNYFIGSIAGTVFKHDGTTRTNYTGFTGNAYEPVVAGGKVVVGGTNGIWMGLLTATTLTQSYTSTSGNSFQPFFAKTRIMVTSGPSIWDLTLPGTGSLDSTAPLYTHPSATFTWTSMSEAPGAILVAGRDSGYGFIYKIDLEDTGVTGATPTLGAPQLLCDFPPGEEVWSIKTYLSSYLAIGTSKGVRVGAISTTVSGVVVVNYGPIVIPTVNPVRCFSARDRFAFGGIEAGLDGNSGIARLDLSQEIGETGSQRYAYAFDGQAHVTGQVQSASFLGVSDRLVFAVQGAGIFLQSTTLFENSGYILSGKIRYGTSENKTFNYLKVRASIPGDSGISVDTIRQDTTDEFLQRLTAAWDTATDLTLRTLSDTGEEYASIMLTLDSGTDLMSTPVLTSMQVKGTPKPRISRDIKLPLRLEDVEQDRNGNKIGATGESIARLLMLEQIEQDNTTVLFTDFNTMESFTAQIRQVSFTRDTPPSRNRGNFGGILTVTLLKL